MKEKNPFLEAALFYARRLNRPVLPLKPRSKEPNGKLVPNGHLQASTDEKTIRGWWKQCPRGNVGIRMGGRIWCLDRDPAGEDAYARLVAEHGPLADTLCQTTGRRGQHRIYLQPASGPPIGCHIALFPGIDIKGEGGYIVAAPSIHPETGDPYFWDTAKGKHFPGGDPARRRVAGRVDPEAGREPQVEGL